MGNPTLIPDNALTELTKKTYDDVVHPPAKEVGKALGTVMGCINMLFAPLERAQIKSIAKTEKLKNKLKKDTRRFQKKIELNHLYKLLDKHLNQ